jgi:hypothetical protein
MASGYAVTGVSCLCSFVLAHARGKGMELGCGVAAELEDLRWHWGGAYDISEGSGAWRAVRADNQVALVAASAGELHDLIRADYAARPVPRS